MTRAWFARPLPGAPVLLEVCVGLTLVRSMTLVRCLAGAEATPND